MPDNGDPGCNLACQTKIIINGGNVARILESTCEGLQHFFSNGGSLQHSLALIKALNDIESQAIEVQKLALKATGYTGPVGKMLQ
jgi:hypothetical protein